MHTHRARLPAREDRRKGEEPQQLRVCVLFILADCKLSSSLKKWNRPMYSSEYDVTEKHTLDTFCKVLISLSWCARETNEAHVTSKLPTAKWREGKSASKRPDGVWDDLWTRERRQNIQKMMENDEKTILGRRAEAGQERGGTRVWMNSKGRILKKVKVWIYL